MNILLPVREELTVAYKKLSKLKKIMRKTNTEMLGLEQMTLESRLFH